MENKRIEYSGKTGLLPETQERLEGLISQEWFHSLLEDLQSTLTERKFRVAWELIEMKWELGDRIIQERDNFERAKISDKESVSLVTVALGLSERDVYRCIQFRKKYPNLDELPEGKSINWHKIVNKYLPEPRKELKEEECQHKNTETIYKCKDCGKFISHSQEEKL